MIHKIRKRYSRYNITTKIRYSYFVILIPMAVFLLSCVINLRMGNKRYDDMIESAVVASDFSLDFKKDFDYETYLVIVGNKSVEESRLDELLLQAHGVVDNLEVLTDSKDNIKRLRSCKRYLDNLATYKERIEENLNQEDKYEDNIKIWENDIQIVTDLLKESMGEYIYYEVKDIQQTRLEYQKSYFEMMIVMIIAFLFVVAIITVLSYAISRSITKPVREISAVTKQIAAGELDVRSSVEEEGELGELSVSLNQMIDKINDLLEQVTTEQIRLRDAELELLQAQINPHFLYNTLDTIIWLAEGGNQKMVVGMVGSLSDFFRASLNKGKEINLIKEELVHVKSYLEIQQIRYQDILEYEIKVPEELNDYCIPKITIQPLVENALYHGIKYKREKGKITVTGNLEKDYFYIFVKDNGIGMQEERLKNVRDAIDNIQGENAEIYGLYNVNERISLKYGKEYGIHIDSVYQEGTTVSIKLPYISREKSTFS